MRDWSEEEEEQLDSHSIVIRIIHWIVIQFLFIQSYVIADVA